MQFQFMTAKKLIRIKLFHEDCFAQHESPRLVHFGPKDKVSDLKTTKAAWSREKFQTGYPDENRYSTCRLSLD